MNIFILNTGRCGSTTFIKACQHINNYSATHESLVTKTGDQRFAYPASHIEADNRLSWFLGKLDQHYANNAFYVHLKRNKNATIRSFSQREDYGIMKAYKEGILLGANQQKPEEIAADYIDTIDLNIKLFLKDKTNTMEFNLETAINDFKIFWDKISAKGNLNNALAEWEINYNKSID